MTQFSDKPISMNIKRGWTPYLHMLRSKELEIIFQNCPELLFETGLELGAGDGFQSTQLAKYIRHLVCTEINPINFPKQNNERIEYKICDAEEIDKNFGDRKFDIIFSSNLLEHLPRYDKTLRNIHNILTDDGITIHSMPSQFWKLCNYFLHVPNLMSVFWEIITRPNGLQEIGHYINSARNTDESKFGDSVKVIRTTRPFILRVLFAAPHGVSKSNLEEFFLFSKKRWENEFTAANFEVIKILKGPVASGYAFGLNWLRAILERIGITSEFIYIARKKGYRCKYEQYF